MRWEILSPILIVASAFVLIGLERLWPYDRRQKFFRAGFVNDLLLYTFVQSWALGYVIKGIIEWLDSGTGLSRLHLVSGWPVWVQFLFFLVTHDLYIYVFHRLQHTYPALWRLHEAHHSTEDVDWLSGSRSHPLEILINQTIEFAPIVLLGAHPDLWFMKATVDAAWGMYIHANIDVRSGWLQKIINGPEMHRWHHTLEIRGGQFNYGTKFAFWDWIFGTGYLPAHKPDAYGVPGLEFPPDYFRQTVHAFRPFRGDTVQAAVEAELAGAAKTGGE